MVDANISLAGQRGPGDGTVGFSGNRNAENATPRKGPNQSPEEAVPARRADQKAIRVLGVQSGAQDTGLNVEGLRRYGHEVEVVRTGAEALERYATADLLLVDLDLPDVDGVELCRTIRAVCDVAIIVVAARDTELDRVLSLRAGADDYVVKPCSLTELSTRIETVMRRFRRQTCNPEDVVQIGSLRINHGTRETCVDGRLINLTRKEFDLLSLLATQPGSVFSRRQIMTQVWRDPRGKPGRTIDTHISSLRNKLGSGKWISTVRGVGFCLASS